MNCDIFYFMTNTLFVLYHETELTIQYTYIYYIYKEFYNIYNIYNYLLI